MKRLTAIGWPVLKGIILSLGLLLLLLPTNRVWGPAYWFLLGLPLLVAGFRRGEDDAFLAWAAYAVAFVVFIGVRSAADDLGFPLRFDYVILADRLVGLGEVPSVRLQNWWYTPAGVTLFDWFMIATHLSYYLVPPLVGMIVWKVDPRRFLRYTAALAICYLLGAGIHILLPTAPPWYAALEGRIPPVHRIVYDLIHGLSPSFYNYGYRVAGGNEVAAIPSMHYATAHLVALASWQWPRARLAGAGYAALMILALAYLGEHYVVDAVAGGLVGAFAWAIAGSVRGRNERRVPEPQAAPRGAGESAPRPAWE